MSRYWIFDWLQPFRRESLLFEGVALSLIHMHCCLLFWHGDNPRFTPIIASGDDALTDILFPKFFKMENWRVIKYILLLYPRGRNRSYWITSNIMTELQSKFSSQFATNSLLKVIDSSKYFFSSLIKLKYFMIKD